jgi:hypothetical protein
MMVTINASLLNTLYCWLKAVAVAIQSGGMVKTWMLICRIVSIDVRKLVSCWISVGCYFKRPVILVVQPNKLAASKSIN